MADLPPVERPVDPYDPLRASDREAQMERFLRGEIVFPGQRYDSREVLDQALDNVRAAHGLPPDPFSLSAQQSPRGAYVDITYPVRDCDACGKPYRGPAVYCSLQCAVADA